jgi:hypothetical protein
LRHFLEDEPLHFFELLAVTELRFFFFDVAFFFAGFASSSSS